MSASARAIEQSDPGLGERCAAAARAALDATAQYAALVRLDELSTRLLRQRAARLDLFYRVVAERPRDVHDLDGLAGIAEHLFAEDESAGAAR